MKDCKGCSRPMQDGPSETCTNCHIECDLREVGRSIKKLSDERDMWRERALKAEVALSLKGAA